MARGGYEIAPWQKFIDENFRHYETAQNHTGLKPDKVKLEMERLRLQNEKLQFELKVKQREYSANSDVQQWVGQMVMQAKRILLRMPSKLAPLVVGRSEVEAEKLMKAEIHSALTQLSTEIPDTAGDKHE